ncbi:MAG: zinc-binding dehydrogenase, partial [Pseudomonadota bacterium]
LAALAGGCSKVVVTDFAQPKLDLIGQYDGMVPVNLGDADAMTRIAAETDEWGCDVVFECSGADPAILQAPQFVCPGGTIVLVGMPVGPAPMDIVSLQAKEVRLETVFRYANVYDRAINLIASGKVDLKPLISETFAFADSIAAFDRAVEARPADVKLQIKV